jgi:hypothetical protein
MSGDFGGAGAHEDDDREPAQDAAAAAEDAVGRGVEALQAAAAEAISAARAVLDVAEELLTDPRTATAVSNLIGSMARGATRTRPAARDEDDDGDDGVQRIPVS